MGATRSALRDIASAYDAVVIVQGLLHTARECARSDAFEGAERRAVEIASTAAGILSGVSRDLLAAVGSDDDRERGSGDQADVLPVGVFGLANAGGEEALPLEGAEAARDRVEALAFNGEGLGAVGDVDSHEGFPSVERDELDTRAAVGSSDAETSGDVPTVGGGADSRAGDPFPAPAGAAAQAGSEATRPDLAWVRKTRPASEIQRKQVQGALSDIWDARDQLAIAQDQLERAIEEL